MVVPRQSDRADTAAVPEQAEARKLALRNLWAATSNGRRDWRQIDELLDRLGDVIGHVG